LSTIIEQPLTASQRAKVATTQLRQLLDLGNLKLLSTALAEVAIAEAKTNPSFVNRLKAIYQDLEQQELPSRGSGKAGATTRRPTSRKLAKPSYKNIIPLDDIEIDPFEELDPAKMLKIYGKDQLPLFLADQTLETMKAAAKKLMAEHPGTKPKSLSSKANVIQYIMQVVAP